MAHKPEFVRFSGKIETLGSHTIQDDGVVYNYITLTDETGKQQYIEDVLVPNRVSTSLKPGVKVTLYAIDFPNLKKISFAFKLGIVSNACFFVVGIFLIVFFFGLFVMYVTAKSIFQIVKYRPIPIPAEELRASFV